MTYDAADGYVVLFSGSSQDETWTFAHGEWTWLSSLTPSNSPPSRVAASMTYDARDGYVVLFGGEQPNSSGYLATNYLQDTWSFGQGVWRDLTPTTVTSTNSPSGRYGAMMTYDSRDGYVVLFGGDYERRFFNDTWSFQGGQWTNITGSAGVAPPCRFEGGMTYDPIDGYVLLFGGDSKQPGGCGAAINNRTLSDTWSLAGGTWTNLTHGIAQSPPAAWSVDMVFDSTDGYVVLFGGIATTDMALQQTWRYSSGSWSLITPPSYPPVSPPARFSASMAYDVNDSYVVLFGGLSEPQKDAPLLGDVWMFRGSVWANATANPPPPYRSSMAMTYDQKDGYVLLFGGLAVTGGTQTALKDTWKFVAGVWFELTPQQSPSARYNASMAYDANPEDQYVVLFGGMSSSGKVLNDTWTFVRGEWTQIAANPTAYPGPRCCAAMAYDANSKIEKIVMFGGWSGSGYDNDTWLFLNGTWGRDTMGSPPAARAGAAMAYDQASSDHYLVMFGGVGAKVLGDTWEFTNQAEWTLVAIKTGVSPSPRYGAGLTYDSADGYMLLFGGANAGSVFSDTWTYLNGSWQELSPSTSPPGRLAFGLTYDTSDLLVLAFSGATSATVNPTVSADAWAYSKGVWTDITNQNERIPIVGGKSSSGPTVEEEALVAVAAAVAVAAVVVLLVRRRRRAKPTLAPAEPSPLSPAP